MTAALLNNAIAARCFSDVYQFNAHSILIRPSVPRRISFLSQIRYSF
ncbi:hypothetical protein LTSEADE_2643 [Salmonella enterica subsp. enterica serovar Adelaide str. A4-669]|uniref:Uncharacterized protein n=1 Tax=Salmonella enterica subsp. enterica serovar Adelaide str. A4-669 TaxID=913063 RepID=A0A6C8GMN8_SALET|nr:hypothetical protein LTSEADE_2643 [Salmonella enterica subsp. enterica serovar Adelaide str. A4-669]